MRLVLLGPPGSGKGTLGVLLAEYYGVPHIATGDIIRHHIAQGTEFGRKVQTAIAGGEFAPDADILYWVDRRLAEPDAVDGYVLDGFPRDLAQAEEFDRRNAQLVQHIDAVVELSIDQAVLVTRLSGRLVCPKCDESYHVVSRPPKSPGVCDRDGERLVRRPDDEPAAIETRFEIYHAVTQPLIDAYRARGLWVSIDANGPPSKVSERIRQALMDRKRATAG